jgi:cysteinyl-tRNA synthetase
MDRALLLRAAQRIRECGKILRLFEEPPERGPGAGIEPELIELLLEIRNFARKNKNYQSADRIRSRLAEFGIVIEDHAQGSTWSRKEV